MASTYTGDGFLVDLVDRRKGTERISTTEEGISGLNLALDSTGCLFLFTSSELLTASGAILEVSAEASVDGWRPDWAGLPSFGR